MASLSAVHERSSLIPASPTSWVAVPVYDEPAVELAPPRVDTQASIPTSAPHAAGSLFPGLSALLWHLRRSLTASFISGVVHLVILIVLGSLIAAPTSSDFAAVPALEVAIENPHKQPEIVPPITAKLETKPPSVRSTVNSVASGQGSSGARGGRGGGDLGGLQLAAVTPKLGVATSTGGSGSGIDRAYGEHMLGEVGELKTEANFFGIKADGKKFAYVVDTSGSMMTNSRYIRCREELIRSVRNLGYGQQYFIVFFNSQTFPMPERKLVEVRPAQLKKTIRWIDAAVPVGLTEPWDGIAMALRMKPDAIYLLTDGEFSTDVLERVVRAQPGPKKIPIHTIAFESVVGQQTLQTISRESGGKYQYVP